MAEPAGGRISPLAVIGDGVRLGERVRIGPGAVLLGPCTVADDVYIGPGAQIGAPPEMTDQPQNAAWAGETAHAGVRIEAGAVIREGAVIHQGSYRETAVGAGAWVLNRAYLAHDVLLGPGATVSAGVSIGGHCVVGARANLGMNAAIHQRVFVGAGCMVGMATPLARDLPPYARAYGSPARIHGLNAVGLDRQGVDPAQIAALEAAYASGDLRLERADPAQWSGSLAEDLAQWRAHEPRRPAVSVMRTA